MSEKLKQCRRCGEFKPLSEFYHNKNEEDNFNVICKHCMNNRVFEEVSPFRKCAKCGEIKPVSNFPHPSSYRCNDCKTEVKDHLVFAQDEDENVKPEVTAEEVRAVGGFKVYILNHIKSGEYKYNVVPTEGELFQTNDKKEFLRYAELHF